MALEGDEVTSDWDRLQPILMCTLPGSEGEDCYGNREECDGCPEAARARERVQMARELEADGPMMLLEITLQPDGTVKWTNQGRFCD